MKLYPLYSNQVLLTSSSPEFAGLTLTGNLIIPNAGYIGSVSATTALQIEADGDILIAGQLGVGVTPGAQVEIAKAAANATLTLSCYHDTEATTPLIIMRKADNTLAAPALVDDNAVLGTILFQGYDGSGWENGAKIEARIQGTPSDGTDLPTELTFWTTPDGSATLAQRLTINADGSSSFAGDVNITATNGIHFITNNTGIFFNVTGVRRDGIFLVSSSDNLIFRRAFNDSMMVLHSSGKLGIRTALPQGTLSIGNTTEGGIAGLNIQTAHETHTLASAATSTTSTIDVPTGAMVLGASFCVNTAVVDSTGDDSWTAQLDGGDATSLGGGAPAQNTKVNTLIVPVVVNAETNVKFTPQGGNFSSGVIEVVVYYIDLTSLADVAV